MPQYAALDPGAVSARGRCTVVVPCYNEAQRLRPEQFTLFLAQGHGIRFLFVNDGSTDKTLFVLRALQQQHPEWIDVFDQQPNAGKAEAVRSGLLEAVKDPETAYVGFWDADLATPLNAIPDLLDKLSSTPGLEMVFGARIRLLGRHIHRKPVRHYLGRCFATVASSLLRLPIYDTQCGAKLFCVTPDLREILKGPFMSRWIFDVEILARFVALRQGNFDHLRDVIYEYPLERWEDVAGSRVKPFDFIRAMRELLQIHQTYLRHPGPASRTAGESTRD